MGISADQFWKTSTNGKQMVEVLINYEFIEETKDVLDWLVGVYAKDLGEQVRRAGGTEEQANATMHNARGRFQGTIDGLNDRNAKAVAAGVIDGVFQRYYDAGPAEYAKAQAWLAGELRKRMK